MNIASKKAISNTASNPNRMNVQTGLGPFPPVTGTTTTPVAVTTTGVLGTIVSMIAGTVAVSCAPEDGPVESDVKALTIRAVRIRIAKKMGFSFI